MTDDTPDRVAATLAAIRERNERVRIKYGYVGDLLALAGAKDDVPRLLAAVEAALKLADGARGVHWGGRYLGWDLDPADLREAITAALTGEEAGDG